MRKQVRTRAHRTWTALSVGQSRVKFEQRRGRASQDARFWVRLPLASPRNISIHPRQMFGTHALHTEGGVSCTMPPRSGLMESALAYHNSSQYDLAINAYIAAYGMARLD